MQDKWQYVTNLSGKLDGKSHIEVIYGDYNSKQSIFNMVEGGICFLY